LEYRRAEFEKAFLALGLGGDLSLRKEFDRIVDGLIVLAEMREEIYGRLSQGNVGNIAWSLSLSCLLPFWPKEKDEQERTQTLRIPLLSQVARKPSTLVIIDRKNGSPLGVAYRGFFEYARSILDLLVPKSVQETIAKSAALREGIKITRDEFLTYRQLTNVLPPEWVGRVLEEYRNLR
jgi:hypothetical protein